MKKINEKSDWEKVIAIATLGIFVAAVVSLFFSIQASNRALDLMQSKTAYIELEVSEYIGDTSYYYLINILNNIESGKKEQIELNMLNTGLMDTGLVVITQREKIENFNFESVRIENIPAGTSNVSYMNFWITNRTDLVGSYDIFLRVYCTNCFDQDEVLYRETEIVIRD